MGIFQCSKDNRVTPSNDWLLFAEQFQHIGAFAYYQKARAGYVDQNAQRILELPAVLTKEEFFSALDSRRIHPHAEWADTYYIGEKIVKLCVTHRGRDTLGFVEDLTAKAERGSEFDHGTHLPRYPFFSQLVGKRLQSSESAYFAAIHVEGLGQISGYLSEDSKNHCMAVVSDTLSEFTSEDILLTPKDFPNFYACFFGTSEAQVYKLLTAMRKSVKECTISSPLAMGEMTDLKLHIGLAHAPTDGNSLRSLIPRAEFALFETRWDSHAPITRFSLEDYEKKKDEYRTEQLFHKVVDENRISYHFQPIVHAQNGEIAGYEALMRPNGDAFRPEQMLELAAKYDRLYDIEYATLYNTMHKLSENQAVFANRLLFINCIPSQLLTESDFNQLALTYEDLFSKVVIEMTEQSDMPDEVIQSLRSRCSLMHAGLAIDDYGSGYANTGILLRSMPQYVKIDRCLISGIHKDVKKQQLVQGVIDYSHNNQISVLAEGVESEEEMKTVIRLGVDLLQGFYTSRPKPFFLEEIAREIKDTIISTNLEMTSAKGKKKIYRTQNESTLDLVQLGIQGYTEVHIHQHELTIIGDPDKQVNMTIQIMDNHSCLLKLRNVHLINAEKPCISVGNFAQLHLTCEGENSLSHMGLHVPQGAFFKLEGQGSLKIDCYSKFGYGIGADCDSGYGNITINTMGRLDIICNSDRSVGIGGGKNPDEAEICIESGDIHINIGSPSGVGVGCMDGIALVYLNENAQLDLAVTGISTAGIGTLSGEVDIDCRARVSFEGAGSRSIGIGVLNQGIGRVQVRETKQRYNMRTNFGTCIGAIGGKVDVEVSHSQIEVNAEGGEITGIGDARGSGNVTLDHTRLTAFILAGKPREAGSRDGQLTMIRSMIIADINDEHIQSDEN